MGVVTVAIGGIVVSSAIRPGLTAREGATGQSVGERKPVTLNRAPYPGCRERLATAACPGPTFVPVERHDRSECRNVTKKHHA
jgi:hypothetical protein